VSWRDCTLGDVMTLKRGHDLPEQQRVEGTVPVVSSSGITGFHNEAKAEPPGVVTGRYGTIGEVFFVDEPYWPLNTALYVIDFKENDPRFVGYLLRNTLRNYKTEKAAVPGVNRNVLHLLKVRAPDRSTQGAVVSVLSTYDDLIENNRRRIALLGEATRMLYREWFVRFRFPGHEH
jgi:type I restriction enzyme S subunit